MNKMSTSSRWSGSSGSCPHGKGRGSPGACPYVGHTFFPPTRGAAYAPGDFHNGAMSSMFHAFTVTHYLMIALPGGGEAVDSSCLESTSTTSMLCLAVTLRKGFGHCSSRWWAGAGLEPPGVSRSWSKRKVPPRNPLRLSARRICAPGMAGGWRL